MCCSVNCIAGQLWTPICMMHRPEWNGPCGTGMHVSLEPQPVPVGAPPQARPVDPHVTGGRFGIVALGAHELPETVAAATVAETLQGCVPVLHVVALGCWGPHWVPP